MSCCGAVIRFLYSEGGGGDNGLGAGLLVGDESSRLLGLFGLVINAVATRPDWGTTTPHLIGAQLSVITKTRMISVYL